MKRQIKFRGKRTDNGNWVFGYLTHLTGMHKTCIKSDGYYISDEQGRQPIHLVEESTVGQFTGLLDRNGKEIYEGDILEYENRRVSDSNVVAYKEWAFMLTNRDGSKFFPYRSEVIGNIHDIKSEGLK
jgi:uncharacterized phage protein (TIGR01671 family)